MKELRISKDLALPLDACTEKLAWLGRTGSGKTYGCKRFVEQLLRAGAQVLVVDTVGVWPGLRLGPKAFDVPVLGGLYGDVPLEPTAGALVADLVVARGTSLILDVSLMNDSERSRFMAAFGERFFMAKKKSKSAVHVVLEECQEVVPQNPQKGEEKMLHEWTRIVKLGRNFGIGVSFISQRPQEVNKKALNQAECVFAFQLTGPHERKALAYWLSDRGAAKDAEKLDDILPTLERGAPHVWSPSWLKISKVVKILPIDTLDTSETPKVGERAFEAKKLTPIDLDAIRTQMAETLERAKADDPRELKKRIAELEKAAKVSHRDVKPEKVTERVEVTVFDREKFGELHKAVHEHVDAAAAALAHVRGEVGRLLVDYRKARESEAKAPMRIQTSTPAPSSVVTLTSKFPGHGSNGHTHPAPRLPPKGSTGDASVGTGGLRRILVALAQAGRPLSQRSLGLRAGLSSRSGTFSTYLSRARSEGWIDGRGDLTITDAGVTALGSYEPLPTGGALLEYWLRELGEGGAGRMLRALGEAYPGALSQDELGERAEISSRSGTFSTYLSRLRGLELVEGRGEIRMSEELR